MAVTFDGTDDYLVTSRMADTEGQAGLTVGGWFYVTADRDHWCVCKGLSTAGYNVLLWCDDVGADISPVNPLATNTWAFNMGGTGSGNDRINGTTGLRQLNTWQHIVGVMSGRFRGLYFNGVLNASHSSASTTSTVISVAANYHIGDWQPMGRDRLGGMAADVFVYPAALSAAQIAMIYAHRRVPWNIVAGCECYLPLMGPTGVAVNTAHWGTKDLSGNGNSVSSIASAPVWADDPLPPQAWVDGWFGGAGGISAVLLTVTDSVTVADSAAFTHCMTLADAVVLIDTDAFMHLLTIADAVGLAEDDTYRHDIAPADSVTLAEAIALLHRLGVADAVKLSPSVTLEVFTDKEVTVTDALVCRDGITLTKLLTVQDLVLLRQLVRAITPCSGGYFENPSGSCAGAYREDDDQQSNLYQEMV